MKSDIFHREDGQLIPEHESLFNDNLLETVDLGFHLIEKESSYIAEIEAKGLSLNDFKINVADKVLYVIGIRKEKSDNEEACYDEESVYSSFQQSFVLPDDADENSITTEMLQGVLIINIHKAK